MDIRALGGEEFLLFVQVLTLGRDDALRVKHHDILLLCTDGHIELGAADGGSAGAVHHDLHLPDVLANHLHGVLQTGGADDGRSVLVVVHHGDVERLLQALLDIEAFRGLDVLQVDTAEGGGDALHSLAEFLGVFLVHLDIKHIDTAVDLEEQTFSLHHGFAAHGADVAETQHRGAVGYHGHEVALVRVFISIVGVILNLQTGERHAGRIR